MAKGSSGFDKGGNKSNFEKLKIGGGKWPVKRIFLDGKTGTDKQKEYAENLLENAYSIAKKLETIEEFGSGGKKFETQNDPIRAAYKLFSEAIKVRSTYGAVIDYAKRTKITDLANNLSIRASGEGMDVISYVDKGIRAAKEKRKNKR